MAKLHGKLGQGIAAVAYVGAFFVLFKLEFHPIGFLAAGGVLVPVGLFFGFTLYRRWHLIRDIPTSRIRSMAMGHLVEVKGQGSGEVLTAPLGDDCHYFAYELQEEHHSKNGSHWDTVAKGSSGRYFTIDDGTGELLVDTEDAKLVLGEDRTMELDADPLPAGVEEALVEHGLADRKEEKELLGFDYRAGPDMRIVQYSIAPEEDVYVLGRADLTRRDGREVPVMRRDRDHDVFVISDKSEKNLSSYVRLFATGHLVAAVAGLAFLVVFVAF